MKLCPRCGLEKPFSEFYPSKKEGKYESYCKPCKRDYKREWQRANPASVKASKRRYRQAHPEEIAEAKRLKYQQDLEKSRLQLRARRAADPEKHREYAQTAAKKRRELGLNSYYKYGLTPEARETLSEAQDHRCPLCGRPLAEVRQHIDHDHDTGFIRGILCHGCNSKLGWYERQQAKIAAYLAGPHVEPTKRTRRKWAA